MGTDTAPQQYSFQAEIKQLLHLLSHSLYQNREITIRELVELIVDVVCPPLPQPSPPSPSVVGVRVPPVAQASTMNTAPAPMTAYIALRSSIFITTLPFHCEFLIDSRRRAGKMRVVKVARVRTVASSPGSTYRRRVNIRMHIAQTSQLG